MQAQKAVGYQALQTFRVGWTEEVKKRRDPILNACFCYD